MSGVRILVANQWPLHNPSLSLSLSSYPITGVSSCRTVAAGAGNHEIAIADGADDPDSKKSQNIHIQLIRDQVAFFH